MDFANPSEPADTGRAMSRENVETIGLFYEAFNRGDIEAGIQYLHPECELYPALTGPGGRDYYRGREGAREFFELITDAWERMTVEFKETIEAPDGRILAVERWRVCGRDGIEIDTELTDIYALRDGLIVRGDGFRDKADALEAARLPEQPN
jgi:ketosteroid isomerase-like protein